MTRVPRLETLLHPEPPRRLTMFERLPTVFQDPERFRPAQVVEDGLAGGTTWVTAEHMLAQGSEGERIARLQDALARARHDPGPADGSFGPRTESAVRAFQRQRGLVVDGVIGPQTMGELTAPLLRRFLDGLDDVLEPLTTTIDNLAAYVTIETAPDDVLRWLAWMVGADTMAEWGHGRRRAVVARALELHGSRGTVPGIAAVAALHLDLPPHEVLVTDGGETSWDLDPDAELSTRADRTVRVSLPASAGDFRGSRGDHLRRLLEPSLPVGFTVELSVRVAPGSAETGTAEGTGTGAADGAG
ncbi:peptidoglycan-binding protein [Actinotalea sp. K2]|uniref:peptidoglycan-binding protein n=1 Tax=Actinotalea sp. K2 TaxID=2939438 RepID=UPI002017815B|nr:peptidoglycan-binding protein [Actinotalea sp. K2]MCL3860413.1 peptidoglycan-binding protein [Actinotalea sp. K2]